MRALLPAALAAIPAERVGRELRKALAAPAPARFLETLAAGNALVPWFAELEAARDIPAGPARWHKNSVLGHTARIMNLTAGDPLAVWMALCHDLGKTGTDPALLPHHYGHEQRGIALAQGLAERLRLPALFSKAGALAAAEHMKAGMLPRLRPGTRRDLLWRVHQAGLSAPFWRLADADSNSRVGTEALRQLAALLAVRLPPDWWGKGELSARKLRELHCRALTELPALPDPSA
ncbi:MAG: HD domain-containing protein [Desulfovibrio sp.]|nr:HD domain-containing protein [Desulfovibrio sp.]